MNEVPVLPLGFIRLQSQVIVDGAALENGQIWRLCRSPSRVENTHLTKLACFRSSCMSFVVVLNLERCFGCQQADFSQWCMCVWVSSRG